MADLEKVIKGLRCCLKDDCDNCPYYDPEVDHDCDYFGKCLRGNMYADALALLKAQEPVMVEERADTNTINCPKCGKQFARVGRDKSIYLDVDEDPNYCWNCGQAVRWE